MLGLAVVAGLAVLVVFVCWVGGVGAEEWVWCEYWFDWQGEWDGVFVRGWVLWGSWYSTLQDHWGPWEYVAWAPGPPVAPRGGA